MTFFVLGPETADGAWLVSNTDWPAMDARFTGECARDRAYAYMHWMNGRDELHKLVDQVRDEIAAMRTDTRAAIAETARLKALVEELTAVEE